MMIFKKMLSIAFLPLLLVSLLYSQSLSELSKKEKERRDSLKGKRVAVATNADLVKVKKKPALVVESPAVLDETIEGEEMETAETAETTEEMGELTETPEKAAAAATQEQPQAAATPQEPPTAIMSEREFKGTKSDLESKWKAAQEQVELYTLKMNGLWQEFYALDDMKSRELIQLQISETYDKLTRAQVEETRAKQELDDFIANARREGVPSIWIR